MQCTTCQCCKSLIRCGDLRLTTWKCNMSFASDNLKMGNRIVGKQFCLMLCLRQILLSVCLPPTPRSSYACLHLMCKRFLTCTCRIWPKNWQVGVGIHGDAAKLRQDYQIWTHGLVDLSILANAKLTSDPHAVKQWSLSSLAQELTCKQVWWSFLNWK